MSDGRFVEFDDWELGSRLSDTGDGRATLEHLREIRSLDAGGGTVEDLAGVEHLTNLESLQIELATACRNCAALASLEKLAHLDIAVRRGGVSYLAALTRLRTLRLDVFIERDTEPLDLGFLSRLENLEEFSLSYYDRCQRPVDLSPLRGLSGLRRLRLKGYLLEDLSCLAGLAALEHLDLDRCSPAADYLPVRGLDGLSVLKVNGWSDRTRVLELSFLPQAAPLSELSVSGFTVADIRPAGSHRGLLSLALIADRLENLRGLAGLPCLETLDLRENRIDDIGCAAGMEQLRALDLSRNAVYDIRPLTGLPRLESLNLDYNRVGDLSPLRRLPALAHVSLFGNPLTEQTIDTSLFPLAKRGIDIKADESVLERLLRQQTGPL